MPALARLAGKRVRSSECLLNNETVSMWGLIRRLRDQGMTIVLTTHYIEEAEEMADWPLELEDGGTVLSLSFSPAEAPGSVPRLLGQLNQLGLGFADLHTSQSSLEEIFVELVREQS